jgi:putative ABC transport system permease protein
MVADADQILYTDVSSIVTGSIGTMINVLSVVLIVFASISLVVSSVMTAIITYVSVIERTKEIGLRMSVGARGIDISNQFLIESIIISVTGGLIGIILGETIAGLASFLFHLPTSVPGWSITVSFIVCTLIGIGFGYFPARKAARMDPIEAIRYE